MTPQQNQETRGKYYLQAALDGDIVVARTDQTCINPEEAKQIIEVLNNMAAVVGVFDQIFTKLPTPPKDL